MVLTANTIVILVLLALVGFLGSKWLFQKDQALIERRRGAAKLAGILKSYGLVRIPAFLIDLSVNDLVGMATKVQALSELASEGENAVLSEFNAVYEKVLTEKLKTEAGRAFLAAKLADAAQPYDVRVVKDAPAPATK